MLAVIILVIVLLYLALFFIENFKDKERPPGPYRFPPFGNLIQIRMASKFAHVALDKMANEYGDVMSIKMGFLETVIFSSPEAVRLVFSKDETNGRDCSGMMLDRNLKQDKGLAFCNGPDHTETRKFCKDTLGHYGYGNREWMQLLVLDELTEFVSIMEMNVKSSHNGIIHFNHDYFTMSFLNLTSKLFLGKRYDYNDPELHETVEAMNLLMKNGVLGSGIILAYPFLRHIFPETLGYTKQMKGIQLMEKIALKHLNERRKLPYKDQPECFVDHFLQKIDEDQDKKRSVFTDVTYSVIFDDIISGGSDTTSHTVDFAILFLATYPTIQEKMYQEILQVIGPDRQPHLSHKPEMLYTQAVILEATRWNRVLILGGTRVAVDDFTYRDYRIKKGTALMYNLHSLFFNEEIWGDPHVFRPERFLANGQLDEQKSSIIQLAFGAGKRNCFGEVLARDSLFLYTVTLIQKFKFTLPPGHHPDLEPGIGITLYAKPYDAIVTRRNESVYD